MNNYLKLGLCLLLPLIVGGIAGYATATNISNWYSQLNKPFFNPPNWLFAPVWTILYILMGISFYLILQSPKNRDWRKAIYVFIVQLFLNFWWSFLFFKFHLILIALVEILLIWVSIVTMILRFKLVNKTAAYLQIPYLLWVSFATILNAAILWLNK